MALQSPNFTQIPNDLLDDWIGKLSKVEFKIVMMICRKTFGWQKDKDKISLSQFVSTTKAGKQCVIDAIKQLEIYDLIEVNRHDNKTSEYQIKVVSFQDRVVSLRDQSSPKTGQEVVSLRDTQKKVKETKQNKKTPSPLTELRKKIREYFENNNNSGYYHDKKQIGCIETIIKKAHADEKLIFETFKRHKTILSKSKEEFWRHDPHTPAIICAKWDSIQAYKTEMPKASWED